MSEYEVVQVLSSGARDEASVTLELQRRTREDGSYTRPFLKFRVDVAGRQAFYGVDAAEAVASLIMEAMPEARSKQHALLCQQERRKRRQQPRSPGATARQREKERRGAAKTHEQRKAAKSDASRALRSYMRGVKK